MTVSLYKKALPLVAIGFVLLTQYTNCAQYSDNNLLDGTATQLSSCQDYSCLNLSPKANELSLIIASTNLLNVPSWAPYVEVSGKCNPSTFPSNTIRYQIAAQNALGMTYNYNTFSVGAAATDKCINGRFNLRIPKPASPYYDPETKLGYLCDSLNMASQLHYYNGNTNQSDMNNCKKNQSGQCVTCSQTKYLTGSIILKIYGIDADGKIYEHPSKFETALTFRDEYCSNGSACY